MHFNLHRLLDGHTHPLSGKQLCCVTLNLWVIRKVENILHMYGLEIKKNFDSSGIYYLNLTDLLHYEKGKKTPNLMLRLRNYLELGAVTAL